MPVTMHSFTAVALLASVAATERHPVNQEIVDGVLASGAAWKPLPVESNPFASFSASRIQGLMGTILSENRLQPAGSSSPAAGLSFPSGFDAREAFASCRHPIRDQLHCGSCWAFATAETMADNACVLGLAGADAQTVLSPQELLSCEKFGCNGCAGGRINYAWSWVHSDGLASEACMPYTSANGTVTDSCPASLGQQKRSCTAAGEEWNAVSCPKAATVLFTPEMIKAALMDTGAVTTGFDVYEDFMSYKSGIYRHVTGSMKGGHAVKIVGWGVQDATDAASEEEYWIVANSWGPDWGESGYFRFSLADSDCRFGSDSYHCPAADPTPPSPTPLPPTPTPSPPPSPSPLPEGDCISQSDQTSCLSMAQKGEVCTWCDHSSWADCMPPHWSCDSALVA